MDLCSWAELLKNSIIDIMDLIISRTENNTIQKVLVILSPCIANSWIDNKLNAQVCLRNLRSAGLRPGRND